MHKILILTDIHITEDIPIIGLDPAQRFHDALTRAITDHPDAAHLILTGDLAHRGSPAEYARLKDILQSCPLPVTFMLGNHDRRANFREGFPEVAADPDGFIQTILDLPGWRLICLDTLDDPPPPDKHSGLLCPARLAYLDAALDGADDARVIVFTHHHAFRSGFAGMDRIALRNGPDLLARLNGRAEMLVSGHIHRTISAVASGVPCITFKSPCHQMPLSFDDARSSLSVDEPGAYGLLLLTDQGVVAHTEDILPPKAVQTDGPSA